MHQQEEGLPWKKHPNISYNNQQYLLNNLGRSVTRAGVQVKAATNSRIPITASCRDKLKDDDLIKPSSAVEERAKRIILSQMKIVEKTGKARGLRVARNQPTKESVQSSSSSPYLDEKENVGGNNEELTKVNMMNDLKGQDKRDLSIESSSSINNHQSQSIFSFSKALQRNSYEFKPPAAAKYFLWDNSRIGPTHFISPYDFIYHVVTITPACLKSLRMEILKAGLLSRAQSTLCPPSMIGVFMGNPLFNKEMNQWELELNRFESGEKISGLMVGDVVVYCVWSKVNVNEGFNFVELLKS